MYILVYTCIEVQILGCSSLAGRIGGYGAWGLNWLEAYCTKDFWEFLKEMKIFWC